MERATDQFLTARVAPPDTPKKPYVHQSFPTWRWHRELGSQLFQSQATLDAAGDGWQDTPFPEPEVKPAAAVQQMGSDAWSRMVDRLTAENEKLTEENMRLRNTLEDSQDAAKVARLEEDLRIANRARKGLQDKLDLIERNKKLAKEAAKPKPMPEPVVDAKSAEEDDDFESQDTTSLMEMLRRGPLPEEVAAE